MATFQTELGTGVMVIRPTAPRSGVMAGLTAHTEHFLVLIVLFMARETIPWSVFVTRCFVASLALDDQMSTRQRETRKAMVETGVFPHLVVVACFTLGAKLSFVFVVFFVARETIQRRITEGGQVFMTRGALHFRLGMGIFQWKFGAVVLKQPFG
jgi:hypothetical protein